MSDEYFLAVTDPVCIRADEHVYPCSCPTKERPANANSVKPKRKKLWLKLIDGQGLNVRHFTQGKLYAIVGHSSNFCVRVIGDDGAIHPVSGQRFGLKRINEDKSLAPVISSVTERDKLKHFPSLEAWQDAYYKSRSNGIRMLPGNDWVDMARKQTGHSDTCIYSNKSNPDFMCICEPPDPTG
jgi:hypothetical protein